MSRYIRQPGESSFNSADIDSSPNTEWQLVYECINWTQSYSNTVPRWEVDTRSYNSLKLVVNGYCTPNNCQTLWRTNNEGVCYFGVTYPQQYTSISCTVRLTGYGLFGCIIGGYTNNIHAENESSTAVLELYPSGDKMVTWNANNTSRNCWYYNAGVKGVTCQSWDTIRYLEFCIQNRSTIEPATRYASWQLYGHRG